MKPAGQPVQSEAANVGRNKNLETAREMSLTAALSQLDKTLEIVVI